MNRNILHEKTSIYGSPADIENHFVEDIALLISENRLPSYIVVVRSNLQGIYLRRRIASEMGGICNFNFLTLTDIAKSFPRNEGCEMASAEELALLARAALHAQPGDSYFARFRGFEGAEAAFAATFKELSLAGFSGFPDTVDSDKLTDLKSLYNDYRGLLSGNDLREEGALFLEAGSGITTGDQRIFIYGIYEFFRAHKLFIEALAEVRPVRVYLPYNEHLELPRKTITWLQSAGFELEAARGNSTIVNTIDRFADGLFGPEIDGSTAADVISVIAGRDEYEEVTLAAVEIIRLIAEEEAEPDDIAVIVNGLDQYLPIITDIFGEGGDAGVERIPFYLSPGFPARLTREGRALILLLALIAAPRRRRSRFDIIELLSFVRVEDESGKSFLYNRITLNAGVITGDDFAGKLETYIEWSRGKIERARHRDDDNEVRMFETTATEELRELSDKLFKYLKDFDNPKTKSWEYFCKLLRDTVEGIFASPRNYGELLDYIEQLRGLDDLRVSGTTADKSQFVNIATALIESRTEPKGSFGKSGVSVLDMRLARGLRFKTVYILGLTEGNLPRKYRQDPILLDAERGELNRQVEDSIDIPLRSDDFEIDDALLWSVLHTAEQRLYLCCPCAEENALRPKIPSYYLLAAIGKSLGKRYSLGGFYNDYGGASPGRLEALSNEQFFSRSADANRRWVNNSLTEENSNYRKGRELIEKRYSTALTEFDGWIDSDDVAAALRLIMKWGEPISATVLEKYINCPFEFLLTRVLKLEQLAEADQIFELTPMARGNLIHSILFDFYSGLRDSGALPLRGDLADEYEKSLRDICSHRFDEAEQGGIVGLPLSWEAAKRDIKRAVFAYIRGEAASDDDMAPAHFELRFGYRGRGDDEDPRSTPDPLPLNLGERELLFSGKIDRADTGENGARVIDYKAGKSVLAKKKIESYNALQLPIYLLGIAHLTGIDLSHIDAQYSYISTGKMRDLPGEALENDLPLFKRKLAEILDLIEAGYFGNITADCGGEYKKCDWDGICYRATDYIRSRKAEAQPVVSYLRMRDNDFDE